MALKLDIERLGCWLTGSGTTDYICGEKGKFSSSNCKNKVSSGLIKYLKSRNVKAPKREEYTQVLFLTGRRLGASGSQGL